MRSKAQALFTFLSSLLAVLETLTATGLSVWYSQVTFPVLEHCLPDHTGRDSHGYYTCECTEGFIDPPSLNRVVYRFERVPECDLLGTNLIVFKHTVLAFYCVGTVLAVVLIGAALKKLRSVGFCTESGTYLVNPELFAPAEVPSVSRQPSFTSSHPSAAGYSSGYATVTITQRFAATGVSGGGGSSYQDSPSDHSPALSTARPHSSHAMI